MFARGTSKLNIFSFCSVLGAAAVAATGAVAQDVSFKGKRVNVIIGTTPGGGTDLSTRLLGQFLSKHLPGQPQMTYRNMPAGGGVKATNFFANEAPKDGTAWMGGGNAYIDAGTLRKDVVQYDPTKFNFIGGIVRGGSVIMMDKSKVANLSDSTAKPVVVGTPDGFDSWAEMLVWATEYADWNLRFVVGYPGTSAMMLALRRGEIDAFGTSNIAMLKPLEKTGNFKGVLQTGQREQGMVGPQVGYEDVPIITELVEGKLEGLAAETFDYWIKSNQVDKWYALPPGTSSDVVKTYTASFQKAVRDPEFQKQGQHQFGEGFGTQTAADMTEIVATTSYPSAEKLNYIRNMKVKQGLPGEELSDEEKQKLAAKLVTMKEVTSPIAKIEREGRVLHFKAGDEMHKVNVSGSRTEVKIGGKADKRGNIAVGMTCTVTYPVSGGEAQSIDCK